MIAMHYFLSPHYDDAVYSCGALIYQLTQSGQSVTIITLMSGEPPEPLPQTPIVLDNHTRWDVGESPVKVRRAEDRAAADLLGAETQYLDIPDCIYRMADSVALYPDEDSLWQSPHPSDPAIAQLQQLTVPHDAVIYAPLAVGNHVDHQLVRDRAMQFVQDGYTVYFYEDFPYMRDAVALERALDGFDGSLIAEDRPFDETVLLQKVVAMAAYQSQITSFWQDQTAILADVRATFTRQRVSGGIERVWRQQS